MEHVSSVHPTGKFPEKVENLQRWARFPGWNFQTECRVSSTFLVVCTSSRSTVGHRDVPGFTTKWNNFLPIGNSTFAPTEISGFFPKKRKGKKKKAPYGTTQNMKNCFFGVTGCFPRHSQNEPNDSPLQICTAGQMHFSNEKKKIKQLVLFKLDQITRQEKFIVEPSFFTSWSITSEKCRRAHVQENRHISLSIYTSL